jgi:hypothetical protein
METEQITCEMQLCFVAGHPVPCILQLQEKYEFPCNKSNYSAEIFVEAATPYLETNYTRSLHEVHESNSQCGGHTCLHPRVILITKRVEQVMMKSELEVGM